jgi:hypothetical protein
MYRASVEDIALGETTSKKESRNWGIYLLILLFVVGIIFLLILIALARYK